MTEFGGPEVLRARRAAGPGAGRPDEVLIRVTRAGLNFADTHTRTNSYVRKATLPLVPGGEVAGVREDTGERVVALIGTGGYAEYATAPRAHVFAIPDGVDDGTALALILQGTTAWHLYRTAGRVAEGESVVVHSAAGGVGSLAVQLGHPLGAGRVIGDGLQRAASARSRWSSARTWRSIPRRRGCTERLLRGQRRRAGGRRVRHGRRRGVRRLLRGARAISGGSSSAGSPREQPNRVSTGSLLRHSRAVVGFYLFHCLRAPGDVRRGARGPVRARRARRAARDRGGNLPAGRGRAGARSTCAGGARRASCCSTRPRRRPIGSPAAVNGLRGPMPKR